MFQEDLRDTKPHDSVRFRVVRFDNRSANDLYYQKPKDI